MSLPRSRSRSKSRAGTKCRSRSRDRSKSRRCRSRSISRSPMSRRKRHVGERTAPSTSKCLGVFGLCPYTTERELTKVFEQYGELATVTVVLDSKTCKSRGFGFVTFVNLEDAVAAKEAIGDNTYIDNQKIRVDYSITKRAHTPTPGIYLGSNIVKDYRFNRRRIRSSPIRGPRNSTTSVSPTREANHSPSPQYKSRRSPVPRRRSPSRSRSPYYKRYYSPPCDRREYSAPGRRDECSGNSHGCHECGGHGAHRRVREPYHARSYHGRERWIRKEPHEAAAGNNKRGNARPHLSPEYVPQEHHGRDCGPHYHGQDVGPLHYRPGYIPIFREGFYPVFRPRPMAKPCYIPSNRFSKR